MSERRSGLGRVVRLAGLPTAHAARVVTGVGRRIGGRPADLVAAEVQRRTAEQLFSVLGELKGGAMKVGQVVSTMEAGLPDELKGPYRDALVRLQETAPPMPTATVHEVMTAAWGRRWRDRFTAFDDRPVAAASIGQVHRARWIDGTDVAVKVQYPGAADALRADVKQLHRLAPFVRLGAPHLDAEQLFDTLRARLMDELDYEREADAQQAFADGFRGDDDIWVPDVVEACPTVLVSLWVGGTKLAAVIEAGAPPERDRAGLLLLRLFASSPARVGRLHADPHPGNFRFLDDGRLGVLDFGSWEPMARGWPGALGELLMAGRDRRASELSAIAHRAGLVRRGALADDVLLGVAEPYLEPLRAPSFTFSPDWLRALVRRSSDPRGASARAQRHLQAPASRVLVQRVAVGLVGVLCSLEAQVPVPRELAAWIPGYDDSSPAA